MSGVYVRAWLAGAKAAIADIEAGLPYAVQRSAMQAIGYQYSLLSRDAQIITVFGLGYGTIYEDLGQIPEQFPEPS